MPVSTPHLINQPTIEVITSMNLRRQSGRVLNRIEYRGESFIISRDGKPIALLAPLPEELNDPSQTARNEFAKLTQQIQEKFTDLPREETQKLVEEAVEWAQNPS